MSVVGTILPPEPSLGEVLRELRAATAELREVATDVKALAIRVTTTLELHSAELRSLQGRQEAAERLNQILADAHTARDAFLDQCVRSLNRIEDALNIVR